MTASDPTMSCGVYVHLPYCRSRCGYCSFVVSTDDSSRAAYLSALGFGIVLLNFVPISYFLTRSHNF